MPFLFPSIMFLRNVPRLWTFCGPLSCRMMAIDEGGTEPLSKQLTFWIGGKTMSNATSGRKSNLYRVGLILALLLALSSIVMPVGATPPEDVHFDISVTYYNLPTDVGTGTWSASGLFAGSGDAVQVSQPLGLGSRWMLAGGSCYNYVDRSHYLGHDHCSHSDHQDHRRTWVFLLLCPGKLGHLVRYRRLYRPAWSRGRDGDRLSGFQRRRELRRELRSERPSALSLATPVVTRTISLWICWQQPDA